MTESVTTLTLSDYDQACLSGDLGEGLQFAMQVVVRAADIMNAPHLIDVSFLHIDACHYYGRAHNDFAAYFVDRGVTFDLPAWTNTITVSLVQPEVRVDADFRVMTEARTLADLYVAMGANPVWTCAPYQLPGGPGFGDDIVGSESNAVAYYNSVVGARTNKYGDFLDVCAGLVKRVPFAGLHTDAGRRGQLGFDIRDLPDALKESEIFCHVLGTLVGARTGRRIPVIHGLPQHTTLDSLKGISAAGAASGGVGLFHAIGVTPEAATLDDAYQGQEPDDVIPVTLDMIRQQRDALSGVNSGTLNMIALGTPHFSITEFERLVAALDGRRVHDDVTFYISTSRHVASQVESAGWSDLLAAARITVLVDTCTYFAPAVQAARGRVMTNSAKWAYYAPGMLPVEVAFGSLDDCVESAVAGEVVRDQAVWGDT